MAGTVPWSEVQAAGVKRLSLGASLYMRMLGNLVQAAKELSAGDVAAGAGEAPSTSQGVSFRQFSEQMRQATSA
jgi:hypothetical protein